MNAGPAAMPRETATPGSGGSAAPPAQAASEGPSGGDVYLDGTLVGRWIADHLAREATRPPAGATGFDTRLTPAWSSGHLT